MLFHCLSAPPPPPRPGKLAGKRSLNKSPSVEPELPVFDEEYVEMGSSPIDKVLPLPNHQPLPTVRKLLYENISVCIN